MKHSCPEKNRNAPLNRKKFNPSGIRINSTGQAWQAKENENSIRARVIKFSLCSLCLCGKVFLDEIYKPPCKG